MTTNGAAAQRLRLLRKSASNKNDHTGKHRTEQQELGRKHDEKPTKHDNPNRDKDSKRNTLDGRYTANAETGGEFVCETDREPHLKRSCFHCGPESYPFNNSKKGKAKAKGPCSVGSTFAQQRVIERTNERTKECGRRRRCCRRRRRCCCRSPSRTTDYRAKPIHRRLEQGPQAARI